MINIKAICGAGIILKLKSKHSSSSKNKAAISSLSYLNKCKTSVIAHFKVNNKIVAAFRKMHVSPAKHSYV